MLYKFLLAYRSSYIKKHVLGMQSIMSLWAELILKKAAIVSNN